MWGKRSFAGTVLTVVVVALGATAQAQWLGPFASLEHGVRPACPFACDSVALRLAGELTSTNWKTPALTGWNRVGDSISVFVDVEFLDGPALPVLVPFELFVSLGLLPEGAYRVVYAISIINPMATMPTNPVVVVTDGFRVAPPGDLTCDGEVNVRDVVRLITHIFRGGPLPDPAKRADVNCDGATNLQDVIQLVIHVFRGGAVCDPCTPEGAPLVGAWEWVYAIGGIAVQKRTPATEGYTQTNTYRSDGVFELRRNGVLQVHTPYTVTREPHPWFPPDSVLVVRYGDSGLTPQMLDGIVADTLTLIDVCLDCFEWKFVHGR